MIRCQECNFLIASAHEGETCPSCGYMISPLKIEENEDATWDEEDEENEEDDWFFSEDWDEDDYDEEEEEE